MRHIPPAYIHLGILISIICGLCITPAYARLTSSAPEAYVSALTVRSQTDGIGPFDDTDEPGYDSSADNRIVRSFDSITYLLEYTTELSDASHPITGPVTLQATFTLPCSPHKAQFNPQTLNWAKNSRITYEYDDGTSSPTLDDTKTVVRQIYTAERVLEGKGSDDRVPGAGQLSCGINVYAATQDDVIQPTFELVVQDNNRTKQTQPEAVRVSSYPFFNLDISQGWEAMRNARYVDWDTGQTRLNDPTDTLDYGRIYGNSVGFAIKNTSASRGLKG